MNNQDPQTAIDYNLYPSSARPSGLQVPVRQALSTTAGHDYKSPEEVAAIVAERDAAVKEAARRDQKWMDGINEIMGYKLDYGDPSSPNAASTGLEKYAKLQAQLTAHTQALKVAKELLCSAEDKLQFGVGSRDFDPENHTEAAKWQSQRDQSVATINNLLK